MDHKLSVSKSIAISQPRDSVWRVLTEPAFIKQYLYGADLVTDWIVGRPIAFRGEYEGHLWEDRGIVLACDPPRLLEYTYYSGSCGLDDRPENYATVTYRLDEVHGGTVLSVRQQGYPSEASRTSSDAGWDSVLSQVKALADAG